MRAFCVTWERRAVENGCFLLFWWVFNAARQTALDARFCINENHSLGEWFKKSLLAIM